MIYDFPAVFYPDDNCIAFHFYDKDGWFSFGDNMAEAIEAAEDVLNGNLLRLEKRGEKVPSPSKLDDVVLKANQTLRMIHAGTEKYARELEEIKRQEELAATENPMKALRESKGWTIKEFADILGAPYRTVQDWNSGKSQPPHWIQKLIINSVQNSI